MPAGVPTYVTDPRFAFKRSYLKGIYFRHDLSDWTWVDNTLTVTVSGSPDATVEYVFDERFVPWSSNAWTLDFVLVSATYWYPPSPTIYQLPYQIGYRIPPGEAAGYILLDCVYGANLSKQDFDPAPPGYWRPPFYEG